MKELITQVQNWAKEKGLNDPEKQYLKVLEEIGETAGAILKGKPREEILNEIGDIAVTVIIYYWQKNRVLYYDSIEYSGQEVSSSLKDITWCLVEADLEILDYVQDLSISYNSNVEECLTLAWNKIKDRQGKTIDGTFVKDSDIIKQP